MSKLIKCKTCDGNVSTGADNCPHCGEPNFKEVKVYKGAAGPTKHEQEVWRSRRAAFGSSSKKNPYFDD